MVALGGSRLAGWLDFQTPITRIATETRIVVTDRRLEDRPATVDGGLHMDTLAEAPVALDNRVGCVDAINDDGHPRAARNHDVRAIAAGKGGPGRPDQNRQCKCCAH